MNIDEKLNEHKKITSEISVLKDKIKEKYTELNAELMKTNSVISKVAEQIYKDLDSLFNKKSKLEISASTIKREIIKELEL